MTSSIGHRIPTVLILASEDSGVSEFPGVLRQSWGCLCHWNARSIGLLRGGHPVCLSTSLSRLWGDYIFLVLRGTTSGACSGLRPSRFPEVESDGLTFRLGNALLFATMMRLTLTLCRRWRDVLLVAILFLSGNLIGTDVCRGVVWLCLLLNFFGLCFDCSSSRL